MRRMTKRTWPHYAAVVVMAVVATAAFACAPQPAPGPTTTTTTSTTLPWSEPTGAWTSFTMGCTANVFGTYYPFTQSASVNVDAPSSVQQGDTFFMTVSPGPFIVPTDVQGFQLSAVKGMTIRFPLSPNLQFVDSVMSAGINMGAGYPSVTVEGSDLVYRVPGPFTPGATVQMPFVRLEVTATGAPGSTIEVRMTSMASVATVGAIDVPTSCTPPAPNPLFWSTSITS